MQGTSWEDPGVSLGILRTVWRAVCAGTSWEDPGMSLGILQVRRAVCAGDIQGGSQDVLRDPPDSEEGCVCRGHPGRIPGCPLGSSGQ